MTPLLTKQDVATRLQVTVRTVERRHKRGQLPDPAIDRPGFLRWWPQDFEKPDSDKTRQNATNAK